jgi:hypothetical protein
MRFVSKEMEKATRKKRQASHEKNKRRLPGCARLESNEKQYF